MPTIDLDYPQKIHFSDPLSEAPPLIRRNESMFRIVKHRAKSELNKNPYIYVAGSDKKFTILEQLLTKNLDGRNVQNYL